MKNLYHICITSHKEVMFRSPDDYRWVHNALALTLHRYDSKLYANAFMSNHLHLVVLSEKPRELIKALRINYTHYFNTKYLRSGPLGEKRVFVQQIDGPHHTLAAITYCLRNAVHHGVCSSAFEYPWCSSRAYFSKEFAHNETATNVAFEPFDANNFFHSEKMRLPSHFQLDANGFVKLEFFTEIMQVRLIYASVRKFSYFLTRPSSKEWYQEQLQDKNNLEPITLETYEAACGGSIERMRARENQRYCPLEVNDWQLCKLIDSKYLIKYHKPSYTHLSLNEKKVIAQQILKDKKVRKSQLERCLAMASASSN